MLVSSLTVEKPKRNVLDIINNPIKVNVPASHPFSKFYGTAYKWGVTTVLNYLKEVIELPQYEDAFLRYEINGYSFICLDDKTVNQLGTGTYSSMLHNIKISSHAKQLREIVLQTSRVGCPVLNSVRSSLTDSLEECLSIHLASLIFCDFDSDEVALIVLRRELDGVAIKEAVDASAIEAMFEAATKSVTNSKAIRFVVELKDKYAKEQAVAAALAVSMSAKVAFNGKKHSVSPDDISNSSNGGDSSNEVGKAILDPHDSITAAFALLTENASRDKENILREQTNLVVRDNDALLQIGRAMETTYRTASAGAVSEVSQCLCVHICMCWLFDLCCLCAHVFIHTSVLSATPQTQTARVRSLFLRQKPHHHQPYPHHRPPRSPTCLPSSQTA